MFRIPLPELRVRICHGCGGSGSVGAARLRLRRDPLGPHGRAWQWVVDVDARLPALTEVLATCQGFLVDDDCGRSVGVVEDVEVGPYTAAFLEVRSWGGQRIAVPVDEVVEVAPGGRRLVIACRTGHVPPPERC